MSSSRNNVPNGVKTHYLYNSDGLVSQISRTCPADDIKDAVKVGKQPPKGSLGGEYMLSSILISYNADGQPVSISDSMGRVKTLDRDEMGRIIKEHFPNKTTNAYEYTVTGQVSKVLDSRDNPIRFKWNKFGKVEQKKTAAGQYTDYVYNGYGQLESIVSRFSKKNSVDREIKYSYDEFDRLTAVDYGKGRKKTFTYDSWGKLLKAVSTDGDTRRDLVKHYDEFDRVVRTTEAVFVKGKAQSGGKRTYAYSPTGKRTRLTVTTYGLVGGKMTKQDVIENKWEYNKFGQLVKITKGKDVVEYLYNRQGKVLKRTANLMDTYYTYTPLGQLETKSLGAPYGDEKKTAIATLKYVYATDGTINARIVNGVKQSYQYDQMGQLTAVLDASGAKIEQYTYDNAGNILKKDVGGKVTTYTYDKANQLVSSTYNEGDGSPKTTNYEYDAAGRMIKEGTKSYAYGWLDKVMNITENGKVSNSYSYSMSGQIASSINYGSSSAEATGGQETERFLWDGLALLKRGTTEYVNEPAVTGGNPILANGKGLFNDMLGNSLGVAENDKFTSIKRDAFGKTLENPAGNDYNLFTGKPQIGGLGYAFLFRNYRPNLGKWQTADPMGYPDGLNNFAYCNNKVTDCIDWLGGVSFRSGSFSGRSTSTPAYVSSRSPGAEEYLLLLAARASIASLPGIWPLASAMATHYLDGGGASYTTTPGDIYDIFNSKFNSFKSDATSYLKGISNFQVGSTINFISNGSVDSNWDGYQANQTNNLMLSLNWIYYCISGTATKNADGSIDVSLRIHINDFYDFDSSLAPAGIGLTDHDWYWLAVNGLAVPYNVNGSYGMDTFTIPE